MVPDTAILFFAALAPAQMIADDLTVRMLSFAKEELWAGLAVLAPEGAWLVTEEIKPALIGRP